MILWPAKHTQTAPACQRQHCRFTAGSELLAIAALATAIVFTVILPANLARAAHAADKRLPVPTEQQQQHPRQALEAMFHSRKYQPGTPFDVKQFLIDVRTKYFADTGRPVTRYVALRLGVSLGARYWMPGFAFQALDDLATSYKVDKPQLDVLAAEQAMSVRPTWQLAAINTPQFVYLTLYSRMMQEIPLADTAGDYPYALQMAQIAVRCARLLRSSANLQGALGQLQRQQMLAAIWTQAKLDIAALKLKPSDPTLNLRVGLFTWLAEKKAR